MGDEGKGPVASASVAPSAGDGVVVSTPKQRQIFRQAALERLSTPEQLDQLVVLTGRGTRAATLVVVSLVVGIMAWAWLGVIPDYAEAEGLLVLEGGAVVDVPAPSAGRVVTLGVTLGETVSKGTVLATVDGVELSQDLRHAKERLAEREDRLATLNADLAEEWRIAEGLRQQRRGALVRARDSAVERRDYLKTSLDHLDGLIRRGLSTREAVAETRDRHYEADRQVQEAETDMLRLEEEAFSQRERQGRERRDAEEGVADARRAVVELDLALGQATKVIAPVAGRVTEIKAPVGAFVEPGRAVVALETGDGGVEALVFLPPAQGKNVRAGQSVHLLPVNLKREEVGAIVGDVRSVSPFPMTTEGIRAILRNGELVDHFTAQGAPYLAHVTLGTDPESLSGLKWTSGTGPDHDVGPGSVVSAEIMLRERRPAELIMPFLRKRTGIGY